MMFTWVTQFLKVLKSSRSDLWDFLAILALLFGSWWVLSGDAVGSVKNVGAPYMVSMAKKCFGKYDLYPG